MFGGEECKYGHPDIHTVLGNMYWKGQSVSQSVNVY